MRRTEALPVGTPAPEDTDWGSASLRCLLCEHEESLTIRETRWVWRAPDEADSRPRMVDTGAYLRAKRRGW